MHLEQFLFLLLKFPVETGYVSFLQLKPPDSPGLDPMEHLWVGGSGMNRGVTTAHFQR